MTTRLVLLWIAAFASRTPAQFTTAGNMITPRAAHTATLLRNGKVLITGGLSKGNPPGAAMVPGTCGARLYADTAGKEAQFPLTPSKPANVRVRFVDWPRRSGSDG